MGTLIRHARLGGRLSLPVLTLAIAMIEPALGTGLVPPVRFAVLAAARLAAAGRAAIALPAITMHADEEQDRAGATQTKSRAENRLAMNRHACRLADFDNGKRSWEVRS